MNVSAESRYGGSGTSTSSSTRKSNLSYTACDFGLVVFQRLLIAASIILGYDLIYAPGDIPSMFILHPMARIVRNFFYLTKGVRKWMAIHYNDGIIPKPPMSRSMRVARSTPVNSCVSTAFGGSLRQSPIERRYSEPANNFDIATALKEQGNHSEGAEPKYRYPDMSNSSDFFGHSSLSFCFVLNGLAQSFLGYIEDPDEDMNKIEAAAISKDYARQAASTVHSQTEVSMDQSAQGNTENCRRAKEVVQSILEHDEQQRKAYATDASEDDDIQPLPIPNFDAESILNDEAAKTPVAVQPRPKPVAVQPRRKRISCLTLPPIKESACSHHNNDN